MMPDNAKAPSIDQDPSGGSEILLRLGRKMQKHEKVTDCCCLGSVFYRNVSRSDISLPQVTNIQRDFNVALTGKNCGLKVLEIFHIASELTTRTFQASAGKMLTHDL